ncbi:DUF2325 domain-containing protein [Desulforamulus hydrothermalis]|uniref:DUF2325 domain-containing protein n=1 Tax=Desulforamulus hydrothermalis Lam5 = DSM 18033 TaxID=1121428 RepID=K8EHS4_9FIRM|nr:DUF2325 domain-containing protein [Desulforamulus hydrothermalis]CCO08186.1 conserved hypothetical protein [Desulforamulus hydrothermalis Lam5 = DSM 18033]SHH22937.1 hypothetical protein SAMN02745177_01896 [Desulforamulus hydrothermalis Lam5 = DSM 18033]
MSSIEKKGNQNAGLMGPTPCSRHCSECCCFKRILMVGGITKFKAHYKQIVEQHGCRFEYLDGYMKGGERALINKIKRCDVVFCPIDCNSHNACLSVKKLCKKEGKPYKILSSSSISGIIQAVNQLG